MEQPTHGNNFTTLLYFCYTLGLTIFGEMANLFKTNSEVIAMITLLFQWFAWGGAGVIGFITVIKFLQENGFLPKGKSKK